ncbi:deoxyuridine 5'-triphosphate nucleotidohydrolase [Desulfuribacillus stibiiarsenatis]|uniref:Deoxyuridine 5'-triphosphate nucleotidohydrolase n=1 Tax=Desulfuribacillus stibiiarsenatis TaxID=1390249 RepID=A0A1E5L6T5_9FIRM|nr:dUTP diphosphatase [Desulfuribacillus stibiiarsenatis]OEH85867.1 deoxyuridine 5'-triphosphate nucleotidohydrolase [Desulfuribacillus stibiiarsenatis]
MQNLRIKIKKLSDKIGTVIQEPNYATAGSAGIDLAACIDEPILLEPNNWCKIPTGLALEIQSFNVVGLVFPRSGLALKKGITLQNAVGVIDADYRGSLDIIVRNEGTEPWRIECGDRIAQIVFMPIFRAEFEYTERLETTCRGVQGFGSTGK